MRRLSRPAVAAGLIALTIAVPCSAWYVAGRESVGRERERLLNVARLGAENVALGLAERIGGRLETLRTTESRRPAYHYLPHYHDPTSDCACQSTTPSPLLSGPVDPLVWTHVQVDGGGNLTLPSLPHDGTPGGHGDEAFRLRQRAAFGVLRTATSELTACERHGAPGDAGVVPAGLFGGGEVYALDALRWQTITVDGRPMLAAIRHVRRGSETLHQGFVVATDRVNELLTGAFYEATFAPAHEECVVAVNVDLSGAAWHVSVAAEEALEAARRDGDAAARKLNRTLLAVTAGAMLAGLAVVGLVWQTDRLSRARSRFAASAAHELRTPLAGLRVYGEMLAEGLGDPKKTASYARHISAEADRLGRVVANVLGYSQLERGELRVRPEAGELGRTVSDCVERQRAAIETLGAELVVDVEEGLPPVLFDADAVFQIVQNLVDNAEKHTRGVADRRIHVALRRDGQGVALVVRDHGPGVAPDKRRRLFTAFERGRESEAVAGIGLGLTMVQSLVRAHAGEVTCEDAPGGGAAFTVRFPAIAT